MGFFDIILENTFLLYAVLLGPAIGSFSAVYFERVPRGLSLMGRSKCACGRYLRVTENIPIIGYLKVKGKTKCCRKKIPLNYLLFEIFFLLFFVVCSILSNIIFVSGVILYFLFLAIYFLFVKIKKRI